MKLAPIYLCGAITGKTDIDAKVWREAAAATLPWPTLDPMRHDFRGRELKFIKEIVNLDLADIKQAWALLVNYQSPSVGTAMEIFHAFWSNKPVVIIDSSNGSHNLSPWLIFHSTYIVKTFEEAVIALQRIVEQNPGLDQVPEEAAPAADGEGTRTTDPALPDPALKRTVIAVNRQARVGKKK